MHFGPPAAFWPQMSVRTSNHACWFPHIHQLQGRLRLFQSQMQGYLQSKVFSLFHLPEIAEEIDQFS